MKKMLCLFNPVESKSDGSTAITDEEKEKIAELRSAFQSNLRRSTAESFNRNGPSIVIDGFLYLGNLKNGENQSSLQNLNIKHIINVCDMPVNQDIAKLFDVTHISIGDDPDVNISRYFDSTYEKIKSFREKNEACLVHCAAGVSRSATLVLAYLMKQDQITLKEAHEKLLEKRPQIYPNDGFLAQLLRYEKKILDEKK